MKDLVIVADRVGGGVDIITPSAWALHRLQRNHPGYSKSAGVAALRQSGNKDEEVAATEHLVDLDWETAKMERRGDDVNSARSIAYLAFHALANAGTCTYDEAVAAIASKDCEGYAGHRVVDRSNIPTDRTYRNALKSDLTHDMDAAREILKSRIRAARAPLLAALDIDYQRADENADAVEKKAITARKQAMRDATSNPAIAAAKTIADLEAAWPDVLK